LHLYHDGSRIISFMGTRRPPQKQNIEASLCSLGFQHLDIIIIIHFRQLSLIFLHIFLNNIN